MKKILLFLFLLPAFFSKAQTTFSWRNDQSPGDNASWLSTSPYYFWDGSTGAVPGGAEILFFDGSAGTTMTNNLTATNRYRINFGSTSAASRIINGSTSNAFYDFGNTMPAIFNGSGVTHTINFPFQIGNTSTGTSPNYGMELNASSGNLTFGTSATISAQNNTGTKVLVLRASSGGSGTITLNGVISNGSGTMSLSKIESNVAVLGALNTYTGSTTITGGTLRANISQSGSSGPFGNNSAVKIGASGSLDLNGYNATVYSVSENATSDGGTITLGGGTLTISGGYSGTLFQNSISGTGGIVKQGTGVLSLYGTQAYTGSTTVSGGEVSSSVSMASTSYTINGGTFRIAAANIIPDNANFTVSSGTLQVDQNETISDLNLSGGTLNIASGKTLTINGTFSGGGTIINNGRLVLKGTSTFPGASTTISVMNDLEIYRNPSITLDKDITVSGTLYMALGKLSIGANTLTIGGNLTWCSATTPFIGGNSSNLIINGTGALNSSLFFDQTTDGTTNVLNNITVNRTSTGTLSLGNKLVLLDTYTPTAGTLTTGGFLHLRSTSSKTARIATIVSGGISGDVVVERYIPANRKWRPVSVPLIGTSNNTIYYNWQNNGASGVSNSTGVELWKPGANTATDGFTAAGGTTNILTYTGGNAGSGSGGYTAVTNTKTQVLFDGTGPKPFLLYATGPYGSSNITSGSAATTLKATGTLVQGSGNFGYTSMGAGYWYVTNPYPSAIDFATIGRTNIDNKIYMWDPLLTGMSGQGNYVTTDAGISTPTGGSYSGNSTIIPNGASFFVSSTGGGSLSFSESNKTTGDFSVFGRGNANGQEVFRANILIPSTTDVLTDGVATVFGATYTATPSNEDAEKFNSPTEGIALRRVNKNYAIELRPYITANDTIFLRLLNMNQTNYKLELKAEYFDTNPGFEATLKDSYTNTSTPVSLATDTYYNFTVDANSASTGDRFMIVFKPTTTLPVNITSIKATQKATTVVVDWTVENEVNLKEYQVQKSVDGRNFETLNTVKANNNKAYSSIDNAPSQGANYYRVASISNDDKKQYSNIVLVKFGVKNSEVAVYPNPIKGNTINLQLQNIDKGDYELQVINTVGQVLFRKPIQHNGGSATQTVQMPSNFAKGNYVLKLANQETILFSEKIILE